MKWLAAALAVAVILLQYRVWFSEDGVRGVARLRQAVAAQRAENDQLGERNRQLAAETKSVFEHLPVDLRDAVEIQRERARGIGVAVGAVRIRRGGAGDGIEVAAAR